MSIDARPSRDIVEWTRIHRDDCPDCTRCLKVIDPPTDADPDGHCPTCHIVVNRHDPHAADQPNHRYGDEGITGYYDEPYPGAWDELQQRHDKEATL